MFGDLSTSDLGERMQLSIDNTLELLVDQNLLFEYIDDTGDVALDFEANLVHSVGNVQASDLYEFIDVLNDILSNDDAIDRSLWRARLITRIGGRESLHNL